MQKVIILNKKEGETPLQTLEGFRRRNKAYKNFKMTYAGRLDPMAEGVLVILVDEETKNKDKYLGLDKEYNFEILFGFATDTYDILGKVTNRGYIIVKKEELEKIIQKELKNFKGKLIQKYPVYSSKTVLGKQLFQYARDGESVEIPEREINIKKINLIKIRKAKGGVLKNKIHKRVNSVVGDFRQKEIIKIWDKKIDENQYYFVASLNVKCGSGTYVRGIANSLGENLSIPALAWSIKRTKVGKYMIK